MGHQQTQWIKYLTRHDCFTIEAALQAELANGWEVQTIFAHKWSDCYDTQPNMVVNQLVDENADRPHYNALWFTAFLTRKNAP